MLTSLPPWQFDLFCYFTVFGSLSRRTWNVARLAAQASFKEEISLKGKKHIIFLLDFLYTLIHWIRDPSSDFSNETQNPFLDSRIYSKDTGPGSTMICSIVFISSKAHDGYSQRWGMASHMPFLGKNLGIVEILQRWLRKTRRHEL